MEINTSYLSDHNTYKTNNPEYIVVHNTDNFSEGADARAHASAQLHGNLSGTSVHFYTDDKGIAYQTAELQRGCWHVGVNYGGKLFGTVNNRNSIGVEMCVQKGYDFEKAFENTVELLKTLLRMTGISPEHVVQHYDVCLKNCPSQIRKKNAWKRLQQEIGVPDNAALGQGLYKVTADALNIRSGPGTENDITGVIEDRGVYTIVQIENGNWGRLLSGAGWICLEYAKKI